MSVHNDIEKCSYDVVIGDDASGRIPALIFEAVLEKLYAKKEVPKPQILFLAGARETNFGAHKEKIKEHLIKYMQHDPAKAVLVVTDYIDTGESIDALLTVFEELHFNWKVAAIGSLSKTNNKNFIIGKHGDSTLPKVYSRYDLSGVSKNRGDLLAQHVNHMHEFKVKLLGNIFGKKITYDQQTINSARKDVEKLSEEIVNSYIL